MLLNSNNAEVFRNKTRGEINAMVSSHCKTESCAEKAQVKALAPLKEVFKLQHKHQLGFSLQERATFKD